MASDLDESIHRTCGMKFLFALNILSIGFVYISFFIQVAQLPFQAAKLPRSIGPGWIYLLVVVITQLEYFLWPFEQLNYLYRTHSDQILLIIDPDNMNRWTKLSLIWGGVWSGIGFVGLSLYFTLDQIDEYIFNALYHIIATLIYGFQNWMFYTYLVRL